jgi:hypothetical protein
VSANAAAPAESVPPATLAATIQPRAMRLFYAPVPGRDPLSIHASAAMRSAARSRRHE